MTKKRFFPALVLALSLTVPAWAGVTDVTDGTTANTYTHTYHTKVDAKATFPAPMRSRMTAALWWAT